jgi:hypothetical protein
VPLAGNMNCSGAWLDREADRRTFDIAATSRPIQGHDAGGVLMQARYAYPMTVQTNDHTVDRLKIDVRDAWELRWWCRQFGCTEAQLKAAIDAMGAIAGNVRKYLVREQARQ